MAAPTLDRVRSRADPLDRARTAVDYITRAQRAVVEATMIRDDAIRAALGEHGPTRLAAVTGLSVGRIKQIRAAAPTNGET